MKVLVVGHGAREHALCWRMSQSPSVWGLYCTGGNPGINQIARPVPIEPEDIEELRRFAIAERIDLTVVGPETPLAIGIADEFANVGLTLFGPSRAAAQLEASKIFAKSVMREAGVPTADYAAFNDADTAARYVRALGRPCVVKADGLAFGKGVTVCDSPEQALAAIDEAMVKRRFGLAGESIIVEERLAGEELSFFALCDGNDAIPLGFAQDHKALFDGDGGPNTGGMGAYSPTPRYNDEFGARVMDEIVRPTLRVMAAKGAPYRGVLFAGLMVDGDRINVLEYNVRFGDPECEALMMRFEGDLAETLRAVAQGKAHEANFRLAPQSAVTIVLAAEGYPGDYRKGMHITGLERLEGVEPSPAKVKWALDKVRVKVFHAATAVREAILVTDGGRVLAVTALADGLDRAVEAAYEAASLVRFEGMHFRRDIGRRALAALK